MVDSLIIYVLVNTLRTKTFYFNKLKDKLDSSEHLLDQYN